MHSPFAAVISVADPCQEKFQSAEGETCCHAGRQCSRSGPSTAQKPKGSSASIPHFLDVLASGRRQQLACFRIRELWIGCLNRDEKAVVRNQVEARGPEKRVVEPRQPVQKEHSQQRP